MRKFINIVEGSSDNRDMEQKLRDLIDHPMTEAHLRDVAQRKLNKLLQARATVDAEDEQRNARARATINVPALDFRVFSRFGHNETEIPETDWDKIFVHLTHSKKLTYRDVINRLKPLGCFRIDFSYATTGFVKSNVHVWFHPEDDSEKTADLIEKSLKGTLAGVAKEPTFFRGGTARYFITMAKYHEIRKRR